MQGMISVRGLSKRFGELLAVDNLSFDVQRGEVLGFLGPNGSGKSTTMRMIAGFLTPTGGTAEICGVDVGQRPVTARRHIGYLPEGAPAYPEMTPSDYLGFVASAHGIPVAAINETVDRVAEMTRIGPVLYRPIETLSKGYRRRVGLAHALIHNPDVLILDEPTDGLDPNQKHEMRLLIEQIAPAKAIIVSTHILEEVHAVCTRAIIISHGRILANGTPAELQAHSPYHNAVSITLPQTDVATARQLIAEVDGVTSVEQADEGGDRVRLSALAQSGREILTPLSERLRASDLPVEQVSVQTGHLNDVFRSMTASAEAPGANPKALPGTAAQLPATRRRRPPWQDIWTVCKRELSGYFTTPLAYVFIVIFLATLGALTFFTGKFFAQEQASLDTFFRLHPWLYLFLIPAIAMRLWAEERKTGSIELLLTLPITTTGAVLGKFIAAWVVTAVALALTGSLWVTVNYLGAPDNGVIAAGYAGSFLMAGAYLAIGTFVSAMTKNQVIAFIISAAACFLFTASGLGVVLDLFSGWAPDSLLQGVAAFSFLEHFRSITRGVIDARDLFFFVSTIAFFLFATIVGVERNKQG